MRLRCVLWCKFGLWGYAATDDDDDDDEGSDGDGVVYSNAAMFAYI